MLYVTELVPCQVSPQWQYDRFAFLLADTHDELWSARRYFAIKPDWVKEGGTHREHFSLTPKKHTRIVREWAHRDKVKVITMKEAKAIFAAKKASGVV